MENSQTLQFQLKESQRRYMYNNYLNLDKLKAATGKDDKVCGLTKAADCQRTSCFNKEDVPTDCSIEDEAKDGANAEHYKSHHT